ncbi:hydrogenase maturation nickel metallochaperone HypA/HybF [Alkaliphilus crotonatoxidans]
MHELGVVIEVIKRVEQIATANNLTKIDTLVLQIGELSSIIPRYVEACYPAAVDGTLMQETKLKIEIVPGNVMCQSCHQVFNYLEHHKKCPGCESTKLDLLSGREFLIKEIIAF